MSNFASKPTLNDVQHWKFRPTNYITMGASGQVKASDGILSGMFVSSGTPTVLIYDTTGITGTAIINSVVTAVAGNYNFYDVKFSYGCYVSLTGAGTVTIFYK